MPRTTSLEGAAGMQCGDRTTMPIGTHRDSIGRFHEDLPVVSIEAGHHALRKEHDLGSRQTEPVVVGEEGACGRIIGLAGHDVPANRRIPGDACRLDLLGEYPEQGLPLTGVEGRCPLVHLTKTSALTASHGECGNSTFADHMFDSCGQLVREVHIGHRDDRRGDVLGLLITTIVENEGVDQLRERFQWKSRDLIEQSGSTIRIELLAGIEDVILPAGCQM